MLAQGAVLENKKGEQLLTAPQRVKEEIKRGQSGFSDYTP